MLNPNPDDITVRDIAHALSHICRFTGHTDTFYSVAQHSVLVSKMVPEKYAMDGLMHDATEAFLGDISTPLKSLLPEYQKIEKNFHVIIAYKFGIDFVIPKEVKDADKQICFNEKLSLLPKTELDSEYWGKYGDLNQTFTVSPYASPIMSYNAFMDRYLELC